MIIPLLVSALIALVWGFAVAWRLIDASMEPAHARVPSVLAEKAEVDVDTAGTDAQVTEVADVEGAEGEASPESADAEITEEASPADSAEEGTVREENTGAAPVNVEPEHGTTAASESTESENLSEEAKTVK